MTSKSSKKKEIPLVKALANPDRSQATPLDVFKLARKFWLEGKRIFIGDLAKGVGVSHVTLYRWVESKDRLVIILSKAARNFYFSPNSPLTDKDK